MTVRRGSVLILVAALTAAALGACGSPPKQAAGTASVVSAPVRVARTTDGPVGYRFVGTGSPLVLIMGYGLTMEGWDPRLVHALAEHHKVVLFDNFGIGRTGSLPPPVSIDGMADQTSALISSLGLGRPARPRPTTPPGSRPARSPRPHWSRTAPRTSSTRPPTRTPCTASSAGRS